MQPSLWPWRKWKGWSLDEECSMRPKDALHVAFKAIDLVAQKEESLDDVLAQVLSLQLRLRFAKALQKEWKPNDRVKGVLYSFWQCQCQNAIPLNSKSPEVKFYQHGGLLALAAFGLALNSNPKVVDLSILKDFDSLASVEQIRIIESIEHYQRHPSIDNGLQEVAEFNQGINIQYSYFSRSCRTAPASQLCTSCQTILREERTTNDNALPPSPTPSRKRHRIFDSDAGLGDNPDRVPTASYDTSQLYDKVPINARSSIHQSIVQDQPPTACSIVRSTSSISSTVSRVEVLDPRNTEVTQLQLPVEAQGKLKPGSTASNDTPYFYASEGRPLELQASQTAVTHALQPELHIAPPTAPSAPLASIDPAITEHPDEFDNFTTPLQPHWKYVDYGGHDAPYVQEQGMEYSSSAVAPQIEGQEEFDFTTNCTTFWKPVDFKDSNAQFMQSNVY